MSFHDICLGVGVAHHGNQQVEEQDHEERNEQEPMKLAWTENIISNISLLELFV